MPSLIIGIYNFSKRVPNSSVPLIIIDGRGRSDVVFLENLGTGAATISLGASSDLVEFSSYLTIEDQAKLTFSDFETGVSGDVVSLWNFLNYNLQGSKGDNPFAAGYLALVQDGSNTLLQMDENGGSDYLDGGNGVDTVSYRDSSEARNIYLSNGVAYSQSGTDTDTLISIENVVSSMFDDFIVPDEGDNVISGLSGNDFIRESDFYSGGVNRFYGGAGNDNLVSLYGTTYFNGGAGDDYFRGGVNVDTYIGGIGFDRISFFNEEATQGVIADLRTQTITNDGFGNTETMSSIEGLGSGTQFADELYGNDRGNLIIGGNDRFQLNGAPAIVDGGDGVDYAFFTGGQLGPDTNGDGLADFMSAIDADVFTDADQEFTFVGDAAFSGRAGELRYESDGTRTLVEADYDGDGVADFVLVLDGDIPLETTDFVL